jgi:hypothetical protein
MEVLEAGLDCWTGLGLQQDWEGRPVRRDLDNSPRAARRLMQSKGEAELRSVLVDGCFWAGCLVLVLVVVVLVISFGLARFENRGTRCQPVEAEDQRIPRRRSVGGQALVRTDWNANCRDITMLES